MRLIVALAGLGAVLLPILYALAMVGVWAIVRDRAIRHAVLAGMTLLALSVPIRVGIAYWVTSDNADRFASYCTQFTAPEINGNVSGIGAIRANFDPDNRERNLTIGIGNVAFPYYVASRLLLTGERPYLSIDTVATGGHKVTRLDGREEQSERATGPVTARYGFEWRDNGYGMNDAIGSAELVLMDYETGAQLGVQPVFVLITPGIRAVPGFAATPFMVQSQSIRSCPEPLALARFVQSVLQPAPLVWP